MDADAPCRSNICIPEIAVDLTTQYRERSEAIERRLIVSSS